MTWQVRELSSLAEIEHMSGYLCISSPLWIKEGGLMDTHRKLHHGVSGHRSRGTLAACHRMCC